MTRETRYQSFQIQIASSWLLLWLLESLADQARVCFNQRPFNTLFLLFCICKASRLLTDTISSQNSNKSSYLRLSLGDMFYTWIGCVVAVKLCKFKTLLAESSSYKIRTTQMIAFPEQNSHFPLNLTCWSLGDLQLNLINDQNER